MQAVKWNVQTTLPNILKERLAGKNLSQIARELGIPKSLLADWTASRRLPSLKNIEAVAKLASYLGLTLEQLLLAKPHESKVISAISFEDEKRVYRLSIERVK
jgi:transcriptional regulator with XRE-family HTH domain